MFKNLHLKFFALFLAALFWFFVVSLENTFFILPGKVSMQVFNQAPNLALASELPEVQLTLRSNDPVVLRTLTPSDFEAYIDLRAVGVGKRRVQVSVTSKHPQVNVLKISPSEIEVELQIIREKLVLLKTEVSGLPKSGYRVESIKLAQERTTISGAESVLERIAKVVAQVTLDGTEDVSMNKITTLAAYDAQGVVIEGIKFTEPTIEVALTIVEVESRKEVGIKPKFVGSVSNGAVKKITVNPAIISVVGTKEILNALDQVETEVIDLSGVIESFQKTVKIVLPAGVELPKGQKDEVIVKVDIDKNF